MLYVWVSESSLTNFPCKVVSAVWKIMVVKSAIYSKSTHYRTWFNAVNVRAIFSVSRDQLFLHKNYLTTFNEWLPFWWCAMRTQAKLHWTELSWLWLRRNGQRIEKEKSTNQIEWIWIKCKLSLKIQLLSIFVWLCSGEQHSALHVFWVVAVVYDVLCAGNHPLFYFFHLKLNYFNRFHTR